MQKQKTLAASFSLKGKVLKMRELCMSRCI